MRRHRYLDNLVFAVPLGWAAGMVIWVVIALIAVAVRTPSFDEFLPLALDAMRMTFAGPLATLLIPPQTGIFGRMFCCIFLPLMPLPLIFRDSDDEGGPLWRWLPFGAILFSAFTWHMQGTLVWWLSLP